MCSASKPFPVASSKADPQASARLARTIEKNAMALNSRFTVQVDTSRSSAQNLAQESHWGDFATDMTVAEGAGGRVSFSLNYKPSTRLLAAYKSPTIAARLSMAERIALMEAKRRVAAVVKPGMSNYDKVKAIHDEIVDSCHYASDGSDSAVGLLMTGRGNCQAYTGLTWLMMRMADVPCHIVSGRASVDHTWNMVYVDGGWYHLDVAWDDPMGGSRRYDYFCINDELAARTRTWDPRTSEPSGAKSRVFH